MYTMATDFAKLSDGELLDRSATGEEGAFQEIVARYKNGLYAFLRNFLNRTDLIDDVFQETFLQLFTSKDSFDRERPLRPWLYTIAANKAKDALRKMQRTATVSIGTMSDSSEMSFDDMLNVLTSEEERPYDDLEKGEIAANVRRVIADMPDNLREILVMAYFNHFSYKQMSDVLRIPIGTVKSRLHTAVGRFAKEWKTVVRSKKTQ
ncbi:MAG: sigma-70 family RNA polymerase sigma factor [Sedimentisphaerales bacterium]